MNWEVSSSAYEPKGAQDRKEGGNSPDTLEPAQEIRVSHHDRPQGNGYFGLFPTE